MKLHHNQKYDLNSDFFKCIDTEEKAYIFGFLYADGCLSKNSMIIRISKIDIDILNKIKSAIQYEGPLYFSPPKKYYDKRTKKTINTAEAAILQFSHKPIAADLRKLGLTEKKSKTLIFPQSVPEFLLRHFIRGYFDGDGGLSIDKNCLRLKCAIVGTLSFLEGMKEYLQKNKIAIGKITPHNGMYYLYVGKYWNLKRFYTLLYHKSSMWLNRKKDFFNYYFETLPEKRWVGSSQFKGVYYNKHDKNWTVLFRNKRIGSSHDEHNAYRLFKEYEEKWLLDGLILN